MVSIKVPPLGESITEATVSRWLKREGDPVAAGETLGREQTADDSDGVERAENDRQKRNVLRDPALLHDAILVR